MPVDHSPEQDQPAIGTWFRMPNRQMWHCIANEEYGVIWSRCGMRSLETQVLTKARLGEGDTPCARCAGPSR